MVATISQLKKAEFIHRSNEGGVEKFSYAVYNTDRRSALEDYQIGESLLDLTIGQLKHEGFKVSDQHGDFDIWPCYDSMKDEEYTMIIISVATTHEGRKAMIDGLDIC